MTNFLLKKFTKQNDRNSIITLAGVLGILFNIILFSIKLVAGLVMGSVAVISDAINSFSDIGSSTITLFSSKVSSAKPDKEHPFGHGRMEYILTLFVAAIILLAGTELLKESIKKIINPEELSFSWGMFVLLLCTILIKLYMYAYTRNFAKIAKSDLLMAGAKDYLSDLISTTAVILSALVYEIFHWNIDGWAGTIVSILIIWTGFKALRDGVKRLIGTVPSLETHNKVRDIILNGNIIMGVHDIILHDYGPERFIGTAHAEVMSDADIVVVHEELDRIEREVYKTMGISLVMHVDPVICDDERTLAVRQILDEIIAEMSGVSYHDFRIKDCSSGKIEVIFDLVIPYGTNDEEQKKTTDKIARCLHEIDSRYIAVIDVDNE